MNLYIDFQENPTRYAFNYSANVNNKCGLIWSVFLQKTRQVDISH